MTVDEERASGAAMCMPTTQPGYICQPHIADRQPGHRSAVVAQGERHCCEPHLGDAVDERL